jgi:hypothetical protein
LNPVIRGTSASIREPRTAGPTADYDRRGNIVEASGYVRKHFFMSGAEVAKARRLVVETARRLNLQPIAIHIEKIESSPEAFHHRLAAVTRNEQRTIIAPGLHHFEVAYRAAEAVAQVESDGITIVGCG